MAKRLIWRIAVNAMYPNNRRSAQEAREILLHDRIPAATLSRTNAPSEELRTVRIQQHTEEPGQSRQPVGGGGTDHSPEWVRFLLTEGPSHVARGGLRGKCASDHEEQEKRPVHVRPERDQGQRSGKMAELRGAPVLNEQSQDSQEEEVTEELCPEGNAGEDDRHGQCRNDDRHGPIPAHPLGEDGNHREQGEDEDVAHHVKSRPARPLLHREQQDGEKPFVGDVGALGRVRVREYGGLRNAVPDDVFPQLQVERIVRTQVLVGRGERDPEETRDEKEEERESGSLAGLGGGRPRGNHTVSADPGDGIRSSREVSPSRC